jgi:hypothetical protein
VTKSSLPLEYLSSDSKDEDFHPSNEGDYSLDDELIKEVSEELKEEVKALEEGGDVNVEGYSAFVKKYENLNKFPSITPRRDQAVTLSTSSTQVITPTREYISQRPDAKRQ